ncbi:MAG TPA: thioesterase family protein [Solirubrobacteraceae bacterium]|nr:thioesterase family protein [Solirubrobacteraceae bacterium]
MHPAQPPALFVPDGSAFVADAVTRGPWDPAMMHGGAPAALLARAIEAVSPGSELVVTRLTIEFLGPVPIGPVSVDTSLAKPGKRFQIVDATLSADGRPVCLARAVRLRRADLPGAAASGAAPVEPLPPPEAGAAATPLGQVVANMFYPDATEIVRVGGEAGCGHVAAWIRLRGELLPGEPPSPLARTAAAADFTNGLSRILPFEDWVFVNTDLTIQLYRQPEGEWIGLDARTISEPTGVGLSTGVLHDLHGPFGLCAQSLFVAAR